jgi:diguanylate cyclase (GGDEF)-like protein/PAS domain S-box-containing protein
VDVVVLTDERDAGSPAFLPAPVRDALPQLFVETAQPLALIGDDGDLLAVNSGFCALVGRTAGTLAGKRISDLVHLDDRVSHVAAWRGLLAGIAHADRVETRLVRSDGRVVYVVMYRTLVGRRYDRSTAIGLVAVHDETDKVVGQDRTQRLLDISRELGGATVDVTALAGIATRAAADIVGDGAWIWTANADGTMTLAASWHRDPSRRDALEAAVKRPPAATGLLHTSVAMNRPLRLAGSREEAGTEDIWRMFTTYADDFGMAGLLVLPLASRDHTSGVLGVVRDGAGNGASAPYDDGELTDVAALARTAAAGLENALALSAARADGRLVRALLDAVPLMAGVLDATGRVLDVNAAWIRASMRLGGPPRDPVGQSYLDVWDSAATRGITGAAEIHAGVGDVIAGSRSEFSGDSAYARVENDPTDTVAEMWLHVHAAAITTDGEEGRLIVVDHQDITDRKRLEVRLAYEATHDPLTRLPNRTLLIDRINQALVRDRRAGLRTAVLFCDLDDFKQINDMHGHNVGDQVLCAVARRFASTVRASDTVSRIGGDEFVVLIEALPDLDEALIVAGKLVQALQEPADDTPPLPGVSIGLALSSDGATAETLLRASDATMYGVKQSGRGRVSVADYNASASPPHD